MRLLAFTAAIAACSFSPDFGEGTLGCATDGTCPDGYQCNLADHRCYRNGGPRVDAPVTDTPVTPMDGPAIDGPACNTDSDPQNCGSCGHLCPGPRFGSGTATCTGGTCGLSCPGGAMACNGACVGIINDPQNCGGCGADLSQGQTANTHNCAAGRTCMNGTCFPVCEPLTTNCFGACVNEKTDGNHCGSCGGCMFGGYCDQGTCSFATNCAAGETRCTGNQSCTNVQFDPTNCGACGTNCGESGLCVAGMCKSFIYAAAAPECPAAEPTFCSNAHTGNNGVCVAGGACP